jgi:hypothetical protein
MLCCWVTLGADDVGSIGNYGIGKGDNVHLVTYDECMGYMKQIKDECPGGQGGWVDTEFGTVSHFLLSAFAQDGTSTSDTFDQVFGECIRQ